MFNLTDYGFTQAELSAEIPAGLFFGRITEDRRDLYKVICEHGEVPAVIKGSFYHTLNERDELPAVGDFAFIKYNPMGNSQIAGLLPRRSKFSRNNFLGHDADYTKNVVEQVVAANFDYVFILCSLNYDFNLSRIARYLTASWQSGGLPVVVLTKADLCEDVSSKVQEVQKIAREAPVIPLSSKTAFGLDAVAPFMEKGKTIVFLGSSGVGKSSLLNALAGETLMEVKEIREDDSKGRHTTTHRQLHRLPNGTLIIDTPGMRELGLWDAGEAVSMAFSEVEDLIGRCRFSNCTHSSEPGCAILAALDDGSLTPREWRNYQTQKRETAFVENRSAYLKQKTEFHKSLARMNRVRRKGGRDSETGE
jgi:ribosome biogenesis GTPase